MLTWIVGYMTTYSVGHTAGMDGPWFANTQVAQEGWMQFQRAGCAQCHTILGQQGQSTGPDLTTVGERWKAEQMTQLVREPRKFYPNTIMPAFANLSDAEVSTIVKYLETLRGDAKH
jgi:mono/diheme cytochrome c family protein